MILGRKKNNSFIYYHRSLITQSHWKRQKTRRETEATQWLTSVSDGSLHSASGACQAVILLAKDQKWKKDRKPLLDLLPWTPPPSPYSAGEDWKTLGPDGQLLAREQLSVQTRLANAPRLAHAAQDHLLRRQRAKFPWGKEAKNELAESLSNWIQ